MSGLLHLGWFRLVHSQSVAAQEFRAVPGARKAIWHGMIALEKSLRGLLRYSGLKVGASSGGRFDTRIRGPNSQNLPVAARATAEREDLRAPVVTGRHG